MSTYTKIATLNAPEVALAALEAAAEKFNTATEHLTLATKTVLMLVVGPLLGLAFVIALPIVSVLLTAYYGGWLLATRWAAGARFAKNVALFFAAPFVGLAYILAMPFVGLGAVVYFGVKAARK
jgi:hypothetical protein